MFEMFLVGCGKCFIFIILMNELFGFGLKGLFRFVGMLFIVGMLIIEGVLFVEGVLIFGLIFEVIFLVKWWSCLLVRLSVGIGGFVGVGVVVCFCLGLLLCVGLICVCVVFFLGMVFINEIEMKIN